MQKQFVEGLILLAGVISLVLTSELQPGGRQEYIDGTRPAISGDHGLQSKSGAEDCSA